MTIRPLLLAMLLLAQTVAAETTEPAAPPAAEPKAGPVLPAQPLTEPVLYQFLLGEIASQRGELALASEAYLDLARKTRDPRIARRATEVAMYARRAELATAAARLWMELDPGPQAAQQYLVVLLSSGQFAEAGPFLENQFRSSGRPPAELFMQLHGMLLRHPDRQAVLGLLEGLAAGYAEVPEAQFVLAQAAWQAGKAEQARQALDQALRLRPGWEAAALFYGQILEPGGEEAVQAYWRGFLSDHPEARNVRLLYAKLLARAGKYAEARDELEVLRRQGPAHAEVSVTLGLLAMQMGDLDAASADLREAMAMEQADKDLVRSYLAQVEEARRNDEQALSWYRQVGAGPYYLQARLRAALALGRLNRLGEAQALLHEIQAGNEAEQVQVFQAEAQLLRAAKDFEGAYAALSRGLEALPDSQELLYDRAMAAERVGHLDVLERDLRKLIRLRPDHAHAYNALGYTLADRTERLDEAMQFLQQALQLAPEDPFVMDSMGWALFKAKRTGEALDYLKRAMAVRPDPEIAAHLGEVLWTQGERDEARRIWQGALKADPDNESLRETMTRLQP